MQHIGQLKMRLSGISQRKEDCAIAELERKTNRRTPKSVQFGDFQWDIVLLPENDAR